MKEESEIVRVRVCMCVVLMTVLKRLRKRAQEGVREREIRSRETSAPASSSFFLSPTREYLPESKGSERRGGGSRDVLAAEAEGVVAIRSGNVRRGRERRAREERASARKGVMQRSRGRRF